MLLLHLTSSDATLDEEKGALLFLRGRDELCLPRNFNPVLVALAGGADGAAALVVPHRVRVARVNRIFPPAPAAATSNQNRQTILPFGCCGRRWRRAKGEVTRLASSPATPAWPSHFWKQETPRKPWSIASAAWNWPKNSTTPSPWQRPICAWARHKAT